MLDWKFVEDRNRCGLRVLNQGVDNPYQKPYGMIDAI